MMAGDEFVELADITHGSKQKPKNYREAAGGSGQPDFVCSQETHNLEIKVKIQIRFHGIILMK